ncbi:Zinc finger and SCAN domain-containing protein 5C [Mizuhopecten yessoensis]|uniref:Zinc finger and SCAN domain-containing protein 5C n=1 Tax=Mizuhopecten yessoensis TaxID=6573 RepID=A0A210Q2D8_MIZYE|nr:Zinc finger and SCAN domain-containing protein 5C [Mizuhopecten yessoensis]
MASDLYALNDSFHEVELQDTVPQSTNLCDACGKRYITKHGLKRHIQIRHEKNTNMKCHICQAVFTEKGHLQGHANAHHGIRP